MKGPLFQVYFRSTMYNDSKASPSIDFFALHCLLWTTWEKQLCSQTKIAVSVCHRSASLRLSYCWRRVQPVRRLLHHHNLPRKKTIVAPSPSLTITGPVTPGLKNCKPASPIDNSPVGPEAQGTATNAEFTFPVTGCWDLHATRGNASGDVWFKIV
jgi:hypothetical protein